MRDEENKRRIKRITLLIASFLTIVLSIFGGFYIFSEGKFKNFHLNDLNIICSDKTQLENYLNTLNLNYFTFNFFDLESKLKDKFKCIGKISTVKSFPNDLTISIEGRKAEFAVSKILSFEGSNPEINLPLDFEISTESSRTAEPLDLMNKIIKNANDSSISAYLLADSEGVIFEESEENLNLTVLKIIGEDLKLGEKIPGNLIENIKNLSRELSSNDISVDNIIVIGNKLIIDSKPRLIFSLNKRFDYQTTSLQLILTQAKMNSDSNLPGSDFVELIDLRFNNPVVVYSKKKK